MGQRARILTEIFWFGGWRVKDVLFEDASGQLLLPVRGLRPLSPGSWMVLCVERRWAPRCSQCGTVCRSSAHERLPKRRWADLEWAVWPVRIEHAPIRVKCSRCQSNPVEMVAWAEPRQRQTKRLQQRLAIEAASMPVSHVAALHGLCWSTVRRAEPAALARWDATRPQPALRLVGLDEKFLGRRHKRDHKFVTIVSNLETGEPVWIGTGRDEATVTRWLATLSAAQKATIELFAVDMHKPFLNAVRGDPALAHVVVVHDPFHLTKRAGQAMDEMRRDYFFRAGGTLRAVGRGTRWLVLRAWERSSDDQQAKLRELFAYNPRLGRAYQVVEEFRDLVRHAPDRDAMDVGLRRVLRRTQERQNQPLRSWHESLRKHRAQILALAEHRPPAGRIEALNNNWETLVRRARGYRNHDYLFLKLRFMIANPIRNDRGVERFLALGLTPPRPPLREAA
ncbi:MAG: ISL3 family transposase [Polyangiaceae bacterium]